MPRLMRLPRCLRHALKRRLLERIVARRDPDFTIGENYLQRWWVIPRNPFFNIYLHRISGDDDDRALHDHMYVNVSIILSGSYWEHLPGGVAIQRTGGQVIARRPSALHRLSLREDGIYPIVWTLFITGPRVRTWGFQCPQGWRPWYEFVDTENPGQPGRGCD